MVSMHMKIISSGPLTTIQDNGRFGFMEYGIGESGAMDKSSYQKANALVGNIHGEAVLEATLAGPTIEFDGDTLIAFMGADMPAPSRSLRFHQAAAASRIKTAPQPAMKRKERKVGRTGGTSSAGKASSPLTSASAASKARMLSMFGMGSASMAFLRPS